MAGKARAQDKEPANNVEVITPKDAEIERRFKFRTQFSEVGRIQTRLEEQAFLLNLPIVVSKIGGVLHQSYGVTVKAPHDRKEDIEKFAEWFGENVDDLLEPRGWAGLAVKEYIKD